MFLEICQRKIAFLLIIRVRNIRFQRGFRRRSSIEFKISFNKDKYAYRLVT